MQFCYFPFPFGHIQTWWLIADHTASLKVSSTCKTRIRCSAVLYIAYIAYRCHSSDQVEVLGRYRTHIYDHFLLEDRFLRILHLKYDRCLNLFNYILKSLCIKRKNDAVLVLQFNLKKTLQHENSLISKN